ncbi:hypothetical protein Rsub_07750 [Raphidocelis subcapitata]|uniref:Uncharacterized protein n=1 Tax=Raphidocelis subcapitata TaxID=307507 RepID=A0A2V0P8Q2_9CHLO|nr:hypothetical protein Rsub_07750 [Raphidocelis subcapitata]|eukprot:GBF95322.1 hypothetical protein Rsub_07750 [Raphidocelis subcapitata]
MQQLRKPSAAAGVLPAAIRARHAWHGELGQDTGAIYNQLMALVRRARGAAAAAALASGGGGGGGGGDGPPDPGAMAEFRSGGAELAGLKRGTDFDMAANHGPDAWETLEAVEALRRMRWEVTTPAGFEGLRVTPELQAAVTQALPSLIGAGTEHVTQSGCRLLQLVSIQERYSLLLDVAGWIICPELFPRPPSDLGHQAVLLQLVEYTVCQALEKVKQHAELTRRVEQQLEQALGRERGGEQPPAQVRRQAEAVANRGMGAQLCLDAAEMDGERLRAAHAAALSSVGAAAVLGLPPEGVEEAMAWLGARRGSGARDGGDSASEVGSSQAATAAAATAEDAARAAELAQIARTELKRRAAALLVGVDGASSTKRDAAALAGVLGAFAQLACTGAAAPPPAEGAGAAISGADTAAVGMAERLLSLCRACWPKAGAGTAAADERGACNGQQHRQQERQWWQPADSRSGGDGGIDSGSEGWCPQMRAFVLETLCHALLLRFAADCGIGGIYDCVLAAAAGATTAAGLGKEDAGRELEVQVARFTAALQRHRAGTAGPAATGRSSAGGGGGGSGGGGGGGGGGGSGNEGSHAFGGAVLPLQSCPECRSWVADGRRAPSCCDKTFYRFHLWALMARHKPSAQRFFLEQCSACFHSTNLRLWNVIGLCLNQGLINQATELEARLLELSAPFFSTSAARDAEEAQRTRLLPVYARAMTRRLPSGLLVGKALAGWLLLHSLCPAGPIDRRRRMPSHLVGDLTPRNRGVVVGYALVACDALAAAAAPNCGLWQGVDAQEGGLAAGQQRAGEQQQQQREGAGEAARAKSRELLEQHYAELCSLFLAPWHREVCRAAPQGAGYWDAAVRVRAMLSVLRSDPVAGAAAAAATTGAAAAPASAAATGSAAPPGDSVLHKALLAAVGRSNALGLMEAAAEEQPSCETCGCKLPGSDIRRDQTRQKAAQAGGAVACLDCGVALYCSADCASQARTADHGPQACGLMRAAAACGGSGGGAALVDAVFHGAWRIPPHPPAKG